MDSKNKFFDRDDDEFDDEDYEDEDETLDADDDEAFNNRAAVRGPFVGGSGLPGRPFGGLPGRGQSMSDEDEDDDESLSSFRRGSTGGGVSKEDLARRLEQGTGGSSPFGSGSSPFGVKPPSGGSSFGPRPGGATGSPSSPGGGSGFGSSSGSPSSGSSGSTYTPQRPPGTTGPTSGGGATFSPRSGSSPGAPSTSNFGVRSPGSPSAPSSPSTPSPSFGQPKPPFGSGGPGSPASPAPSAPQAAEPKKDEAPKGEEKKGEGDKKGGFGAAFSGFASKLPFGKKADESDGDKDKKAAAPKPDAKKEGDDKDGGDKKGGFTLGGLAGKLPFGKKDDEADKDKKAAPAKPEAKKEGDKKDEGEKKGGLSATLGGITSKLPFGKKGDEADKDKKGEPAKPSGAPAAPGAGLAAPGAGPAASGFRPGVSATAGPAPNVGSSPALGSRAAAAPSASSAPAKEDRTKKSAPQPQGGNFLTRLFKRGAAEEKPATRAKPASKVPVVKDISKEEEGLTLDNWLDILGVGLLFGSLVIFFSAISAERAAIAFVHDFISSALGWGALSVPVAMFAVGLWLVVRHFGDKAPTIDPLRLIGLGVAFICVLTLLQYVHAFSYVGMDNLDLLRLRLDFAWRVERAGGGALGSAVYFFLVSNFTEIGGFFVVLFAGMIAAMLMTRLSASDILLYAYGVTRTVRMGLQARAAAQRAKRQLLEQQRREKLRAMQAATAPVAMAAPASAPPPPPPLAQESAAAPSAERSLAEIALEDRVRVNRGGVTINPGAQESQETPPAPPPFAPAAEPAPASPIPVATPTLTPTPAAEKRGFGLFGRKDSAEAKPSAMPPDPSAAPPTEDKPAPAAEKRGFGLFGRKDSAEAKPSAMPPDPSAAPSTEDKPAPAAEKRGFGLFGRKDSAEVKPSAVQPDLFAAPPTEEKPAPAAEKRGFGLFGRKDKADEKKPDQPPKPAKPIEESKSQDEPSGPQIGKVAAFAAGAVAASMFTRADKPAEPPTPAASQNVPTLPSAPPARPLTPAERAARARQAHASGQSTSAPSPGPAWGETQAEARLAASATDFQRPATPFAPPARPATTPPSANTNRWAALDDDDEADEAAPATPTPAFQRPAAPFAPPSRPTSTSAPPGQRRADLDDEDDEDDEGSRPAARFADLLAPPPSSLRQAGTGDGDEAAAIRADSSPKRFADLLSSPPTAFSASRPALVSDDDDEDDLPAHPFGVGTGPRPMQAAPARPSMPPARWAALDDDKDDELEDFDDETADEDTGDLFPSLASRGNPTPSSPPLRPFGPTPTPPPQPQPPADPLAARTDRLNALRQGQTAPTGDTDKLRAVESTPPPAAPVQPAAAQPPVTRPAEAPLSGTFAPSGPSAFGKPADLATHPSERIPYAETAAEVRPATLPGFPEPEARPSQLPSVQPPGQQGPQQQTLSVPFSSPVVNQTQAQRPTWKIPDYRALLSSGSEQEVDQALLLRQAKIIEDTLESFGAPGRVIEINTGPVITQFGVEPDYLEGRGGKKQRVKVGAIAALDKDLQLSLGARSIRVEAPVPGKGYVGIEIPNPEPTTVRLRDVMDAPNFQRHKSPLGIALGQSVSGAPVSADLAAMPHLLIAGTTGSGKSVCVNSIITSIISRHSPDTVKFIMVDPKRVELTGYNGIPHLIAPVVVELERIVGVLKWVTREMDERYRRFSQAGARNIEDFNKHRDPSTEPLPYIVVIIDELADLMMLAPEETERTIARIAALARATGIHLVIATQRPSVDVVTGLIKANFSTRIAFAVAGSVDSRVILDQPGAERLLGRGDMLYLSGDSPAPVRLQGVYVSDMEINNIVRYWKTQAVGQPQAAPIHIPAANLGEGAGSASRTVERAADRPASGPRQQALWDGVESSIPRLPTSLDEASPLPDGAINGEQMSEDELYEQAVEMVRRLDKASVTLLQRRFRIGYTRAARLIDLMEARGIIGPAKENSSKPRDVLPPR